MSAILTDAGQLHFAQRANGENLTNQFDAVELGQGNTPVSATDTRANLPNRIPGTLMRVAAGYPLRNDQDPENPGRGVNVLSYRFDLPASLPAFTATNLIITNFAGGSPGAVEPVGFAAQISLSKVSGQPLTIFVNKESTDASVVAGAPSPHAFTHAENGTDVIEAGGLALAFVPNNYVPRSQTPGSSTQNIEAHLNGLDDFVGTVEANPFYEVSFFFSPDATIGPSSAGLLQGTRVTSGHERIRINRVVMTVVSVAGAGSVLEGTIFVPHSGDTFGFSIDNAPPFSGSVVVDIPNGFQLLRGQSALIQLISVTGSWTGPAWHWFGDIEAL